MAALLPPRALVLFGGGCVSACCCEAGGSVFCDLPEEIAPLFLAPPLPLLSAALSPSMLMGAAPSLLTLCNVLLLLVRVSWLWDAGCERVCFV